MPTTTKGSLIDNLQKRKDALNEVMNWKELGGTENSPQVTAKKKDTAKPRWYMFGTDKK